MGGTISIGPSSLSDRKKKLHKKEEERRRKQAQEDQDRRRKLLEEYGVLIPPVFLANKTDDPPLSSRVWERVSRESSSDPSSPSTANSDLLSWAYRRRKPTDDDENDAGPLLEQTLLTEYMTPGLFLSLPVAASGANDGGRFVAALTQQPFSEDASSDALPSFISLTKCFDRNSVLFFPFPWTVETFLPQHALLSSSSGNSTTGILPSSMRLAADLSSSSSKNQTKVAWTTHFLDQDTKCNESNTSPSISPLMKKLKGSWVEAETVRPDCWNSGITLRMASAMTLDCFANHVVLEACRAGNDAYQEYNAPESNTNPLGDFLRKQKCKHGGNTRDETLRLRFAAEYKESILASSTNLSLPSLFGKSTTPVVTVNDTLLSLNLNGGGAVNATPTPPPLWLTLKQSKGYTNGAPSSFSLNLSQVVTFDREIWNILEDRAPKVRNHLGWVCQIERFLNHGGSSQNSESELSSKSSSSVLSIGASAQLNRNIAGKVVLESKLGQKPSSSPATTTLPPCAALKFAFVFKRWLEPQASLSVIQKVDLLTGKWSFLGVGLEIEQQKTIGSSTRTERPPKHRRGGAEYRDTADMDATSSVAPPTRVELPTEKR